MVSTPAIIKSMTINMAMSTGLMCMYSACRNVCTMILWTKAFFFLYLCIKSNMSQRANPAKLVNKQSAYKRPRFCYQDDGTTKQAPTNTTCTAWNTAVKQLQTDATKHYVSGNLVKGVSTCYQIDANQIAGYGDKGIFDINRLKANWMDPPSAPGAPNMNCLRTNYGVFQADGTLVQGVGAQSNAYSYYKSQVWDPCTKTPNTPSGQPNTLNDCYDGDDKQPSSSGGFTCHRDGQPVPSMLDDFKSNVQYKAAKDDMSAAVNFNFNCMDPFAATYTMCKVPGWDYMDFDKTKGWVVGDMTQCTINPLAAAPLSNKANCDSADPTKGDSPNIAIPTGKSNDRQPCADWKQEFQTSFSMYDALDTQTPSGAKDASGNSLSYQAYLAQVCDQNYCMANTSTSETRSQQNCEACANNASTVDWSTAQLQMIGKKTLTFNYCDAADGSKFGIAITPTAGQIGGGSAPNFSDVRECQGGTFDNKCMGLLGCAGLNGRSCFGEHGQCGIPGWNDCNGGFSYDGTSPSELNPSTNCPNVYTMSRQSNACNGADYTDNTQPGYIKDMHAMTIPEGAWVTAYWSPAADWSEASGLCSSKDPNVPGQTKYVLQMCCGKLADGTVAGYASAYTMNADTGVMTNITNNIPAPHNKIVGAYLAPKVTTTMNSDKSCTFAHIEKVITGFDPKNGVQTKNEGYKGFTFGFMPGYYNESCKTSRGACAKAST